MKGFNMSNLKIPDSSEMARVLALASGAIKVILFGSRARGDFHASSDWDFLLILPIGAWMQSFETELEVVRVAQKALWDAGFDCFVDVIPMSVASFERGDNVLARLAWREGLTLFESEVIYG
jgi:predicted nucleotidyltransferase